MSSYKRSIVSIGSSDIATLLFVGPNIDANKAALNIYQAKYPEDGSYTSYFVDEENTEIPDHYHLEVEFKDWMTVYDDESCVGRFFAKDFGTVKVYRAGDYDMIIRARRLKMK